MTSTTSIGGFSTGFQPVYTDVPSGARVFAYIRADGDTNLPVLILVHGFPQNALMWKHFVDLLPKNYRILVPDNPGYGNSTKPIAPASSPGAAHSKAAWAADIIAVASAHFGESSPLVFIGHDRGGRITYIAALNAPERVKGAVVMDIVPGSFMWANMNFANGDSEEHRSSHWIFLSSPRPLPETLISGNAKFYFEYLLSAWSPAISSSANKEAKEFPEWVRDAVDPYLDPVRGYDRIVAACEDYRAGATIDIESDRAASINPLSVTSPSQHKSVFSCPILSLASGNLRLRHDVDAIWTALGPPGKVRSVEVKNSGHFVVNEQPEQVAEEVRAYLAKWFENKA